MKQLPKAADLGHHRNVYLLWFIFTFIFIAMDNQKDLWDFLPQELAWLQMLLTLIPMVEWAGQVHMSYGEETRDLASGIFRRIICTGAKHPTVCLHRGHNEWLFCLHLPQSLANLRMAMREHLESERWILSPFLEAALTEWIYCRFKDNWYDFILYVKSIEDGYLNLCFLLFTF